MPEPVLRSPKQTTLDSLLSFVYGVEKLVDIKTHKNPL